MKELARGCMGRILSAYLGSDVHIGDHMEGFRKEDTFGNIFCDIREYCPDLKFPQLHSAIAKVAPAYIAALGERKDCLRKLRYIGCTWCPEVPLDDEFFKLGQVYVGKSFNGATYTIKGYDKNPIGCAYFEWVREGATKHVHD